MALWCKVLESRLSLKAWLDVAGDEVASPKHGDEFDQGILKVESLRGQTYNSREKSVTVRGAQGRLA